jgi:alkylation response protein AidB-like acyl-CoA dehydrogenase
MDFTRTEAAQDLSGLVATIVDSVCTPQHQRTLDDLDQRFDKTLWSKLIDADILSTAAPESVGGGGFCVLEHTAILTPLGRQVAAVPYLDSVVLGAGERRELTMEAEKSAKPSRWWLWWFRWN